MPFTLIKGTFHVVGYSPDGDSVRFQARDNTNWAKLAGPPTKLNGRGHAQLRLEAIDTLETHYLNTHQPLELALAALTSLTAALGITNLVWNQSNTMVTSADDATDGFILAREVEENRRPVAFAFAGETATADGDDIFFDTELLRQSVNFQQIASGMAYPTYYKGLFADLRNELTAAARNARQAGHGVWPRDVTTTGFTVVNLRSISEEHVILPKLFRRLAAYLEGGGIVMSGFPPFLEADEEDILLIPTAHPTHFDDVIEVEGQTVRMTVNPEDIIFGV
jgi:endonuclease YncB( thermonuclease family)